MNRKENPYTPGAGARPPLLAGRDAELDDLGLAFERLGAGLPQLPLMLKDAKPYTERLFDFRTIGGLARSSAAAALTVPAERLGAHFDALADRLSRVRRAARERMVGDAAAACSRRRGSDLGSYQR